ncbi:hypothetical protein [Hoyosella subflava]|uniref:Uncharacterized protein n=1 Tax=Hoyosella subflava (strain DSM 45089 / JCM 17490 / NBRC 109087 / DQS3-9A1) TaxID=443218 RepID=F6ELJ5_HOYSD|nr:hypothetical protein [Hoyosella subflava]AEF40245.1 hypothetical protein AS9A_1796 [Hoyosella subflava DQS3-9A1]
MRVIETGEAIANVESIEVEFIERSAIRVADEWDDAHQGSDAPEIDEPEPEADDSSAEAPDDDQLPGDREPLVVSFRAQDRPEFARFRLRLQLTTESVALSVDLYTQWNWREQRKVNEILPLEFFADYAYPRTFAMGNSTLSELGRSIGVYIGGPTGELESNIATDIRNDLGKEIRAQHQQLSSDESA